MTFKSAMSSLGNGLLTTATVLSNSGIQTQIDEINLEITATEKKLQELRDQKSSLQDRLIRR